ncbi:MAG TPA: hypothetical protein VJN21_04210 [Candidatus Acidoferrales bacterium]|nr:hypothetical protein [Candidatus Acidoferrales bacterium]
MKREGVPPAVRMCRLIAAAIGATTMLIAQIVCAATIQTPLGQISVKGSVAINGRVAITGGSVFSGDRIEAKGDSLDALSLNGGREIVQEGPGVLILNDEGGRLTIEIIAGRAAILSTAKEPIDVEANGLRMVLGSGGGVYDVRLDGKRLSVTARKGYAEIRAVNRTVKVDEGMRCDALLGDAQKSDNGAKNALGAPIVKFTILAAGLVTSATLAVILAEGNSGCTISPSSTGECQPLP